MSDKKVDMVNHPTHYEGSTSIECIQAMHLAFGDIATCYFCLCNSFKYLWRYKNKNGAEDVQKAEWYVNHVEEVMSHRDIQSPEIPKMLERTKVLLEEVKRKL